jgi:Protein of unknown function (DUF3618)
VGQTADQLEADVARTREDMSNTLDAIGEQMSPRIMVKRSSHRIWHWFKSAPESVIEIGSGTDGLGEGDGQSTQSSDASAAHPQGNPLAAGIIAIGIGLLVGSLLPATEVERRAASAIADEVEPAISSAVLAASGVAQGVQGKLGEALNQIVDQTQSLSSEVQETLKPPGRP